MPTPLRRLEDRGSIVVRTLSEGTAAQIVEIVGRVRVQVSDVVAEEARADLAAHCYAVHRLSCCASSCAVARSLVPLPRLAVDAASA